MNNLEGTNTTVAGGNGDGEDPFAYRTLTDVQTTILALLPIPAALLSIFGSCVILYMAQESKRSVNGTKKAWTPYHRLLVAMSVYDILSSLTLAMASFLYPKETSTKALVFGNESTCSAIGFFNQLSYSGTLYNAMLSFYFLLTARFGVSNKTIANRVEPSIHTFSVGYPLLTAFVGLFLGVYGEPEAGLGCWVNRLVLA